MYLFSENKTVPWTHDNRVLENKKVCRVFNASEFQLGRHVWILLRDFGPFVSSSWRPPVS